jgi:hypothetical protein
MQTIRWTMILLLPAIAACGGGGASCGDGLLEDGEICYVPPASFAVQSPQSVAVVDLDDDGDLDVVVASFGTSTLRVLLNDGGEISAAPELAVPGGPQGVAAGDVDGDGVLDLVTANFNNTVSVLLGAGGGQFGAPVVFNTGDAPVEVVLGDFN